MQHSPHGSGTDSGFAASPGAVSQGSAQPAKAREQAGHQRTYQACIPCRNRKVRCDLGSVDNPHDPPCSRCRREAKECYFSLTRRKKKSVTQFDEEEEQEIETYTLKTGRKRVRAPAPEGLQTEPLERPRTPGGSYGSTVPLRRPDPLRAQQFAEEEMQASEQTAAMLQGAELHGGHDALKVLMEAAGIGGRTGSATAPSRPNLHGPSPASLPSVTSPILERTNTVLPAKSRAAIMAEKQLPPQQGSPGSPSDLVSPDTTGYSAAIKAWSRFRFVRSGWFTPAEGIAYIAYFYKFLSPLTPVTLPDFLPVDRHERLLTEEPMLAMTILLISSRHMQLEGPGAMSRSYTIHQRLWTYLQGMIDRVTWGQEQFAKGSMGAGSQPGCDVNPLTRKGLRTLGTVESYMLLTEWHPRAMHFPPDEADDELMTPREPFTPTESEAEDNAKGIGGHRMESWLEPCWRSDRMCWMLLGMAMSLAFEIGVFDKSEWQRHALDVNGQPLSADQMRLYDKRRANVRDLLLIYVTMTSGRLGLTSMLPSNYSKPEDSELYRTQPGDHSTVQESVLQFWLRIAAIMRDVNKKIFANKSFTRDLIKNGSYSAALEQFAEPLARWRRDFDSCMFIPEPMRCMLEIEYEYCRVYLNALSLQAVAERCANEWPRVNESATNPTSSTSTTINGGPTEVAIRPETLSKLLGGDRVYMDEVRKAACNLLTVVVEKLYPSRFLRHAPVRSYFRIISVAIMLLKSFSLGASEADVTDSFNLMDNTVAALRICIVDDVHVASRFAELLDTLTQNLKPRLRRMLADARDAPGGMRGVRATPAPRSGLVNGHGSSRSVGAQSRQSSRRGTNEQAIRPENSWDFDHVARNGYGQDHTLSGISDEAVDLAGNHEYSIMPPPWYQLHSPKDARPTDQKIDNRFANSTSTTSRTAQSYSRYSTIPAAVASDSAYQNAPSSVNGFGSAEDMQTWLAFPLDGLLSLDGVDVNQTMWGPELGGHDMLEFLMSDSNGNHNYQ